MGMDVSGKNPSSDAGKYFRANVWSWRPIHEMIFELCSDLIDEEMMCSLGYNDGAGPDDQETCTKMAQRFENWMEYSVEGKSIDIDDMRVDEGGRFVSLKEVAANPAMVTRSPYNVSDDHLKKWIEFLRHCGGFEVW